MLKSHGTSWSQDQPKPLAWPLTTSSSPQLKLHPRALATLILVNLKASRTLALFEPNLEMRHDSLVLVNEMKRDSEISRYYWTGLEHSLKKEKVWLFQPIQVMASNSMISWKIATDSMISSTSLYSKLDDHHWSYARIGLWPSMTSRITDPITGLALARTTYLRKGDLFSDLGLGLFYLVIAGR